MAKDIRSVRLDAISFDPVVGDFSSVNGRQKRKLSIKLSRCQFSHSL